GARAAVAGAGAPARPQPREVGDGGCAGEPDPPLELRDVDTDEAAQPGDDEITLRLRLDEMLLAADRGAALRDRGAPVLREPQVPPAPARRSRGTERVGTRTETEVVRSVPVGRVVR